MSKQQPTISKERWSSFPIEMRMGHIGSEISRFFSRREKGDRNGAAGCAERANELIELTLDDVNVSESAKKELDILKTVIQDVGNGEPKLNISPRVLNEYFTPFAIFYSLHVQNP